jgi:hypothetical protein
VKISEPYLKEALTTMTRGKMKKAATATSRT